MKYASGQQATPCAHHQCMSSPNPEFKLFFRSYLLFVLCMDGVCACVMVCLRRSEDNTESCFSFTFLWIPGIKLKSLGVYKPSLTRPCYTDLKLCLWNTAFYTVESENWLVKEESKHKNRLHMQSAWAVTCYYSTVCLSCDVLSLLNRAQNRSKYQMTDCIHDPRNSSRLPAQHVLC